MQQTFSESDTASPNGTFVYVVDFAIPIDQNQKFRYL